MVLYLFCFEEGNWSTIDEYLCGCGYLRSYVIYQEKIISMWCFLYLGFFTELSSDQNVFNYCMWLLCKCNCHFWSHAKNIFLNSSYHKWQQKNVPITYHRFVLCLLSRSVWKSSNRFNRWFWSACGNNEVLTKKCNQAQRTRLWLMIFLIWRY